MKISFMTRRRLPWRYRWLIAALGLAAGTWWLLASGNRGITVATVLGLPVAILSLAVVVFGVPGKEEDAAQRGHENLAGAARELARRVGTREAAEQQKLLADTGHARPSDMDFVREELVSWRSDGGGAVGNLSTIADFYAGLRVGRLIILGAAGAGKTVLASHLLIDLIRRLPVANPPPGQALHVPVRLSLAAFDTGPHPADAQPSEMALRLDNWIADQIAITYGISGGIAAALIRGGWILPVLDGLDELDAVGQPPIRAAAVIRALNYPTGPGPRPVVVACRTESYLQLNRLPSTPGYETTLQDATAVTLQPLSGFQVAAYLKRRFPSPVASGRVHPRWQPVLDHLNGPLGMVLGSPLYLFMAITAYYPTNTNPSELTRLTAFAIRSHLINSLIPTITHLNPGPDGHTYHPGDVIRWLSILARHLQAQQDAGRNGADIELHRIWTAAGANVPRYIAATIHAFLAAPIFALAVYWQGSGRTSLISAAIVVVGCATAGAIFWKASRRPVELRRFAVSELRTPLRSGRARFFSGRWFKVSLWVGLLIGIVAALGTSGGTWSRIRWTAGEALAPLVLYMLFGLFRKYIGGFDEWYERVWNNEPTAIKRPSELVRQGAARDITVAFVPFVRIHVFGILGALFLSIYVFIEGDFRSALPGVGLVLLFFWIVIGIPSGGVYTAHSPWLRYLVATRILANRNQLPVRPAIFLDWAHNVGLMRLSGIAVQFRHRDLQDHLAYTIDVQRHQPRTQ